LEEAVITFETKVWEEDWKKVLTLEHVGANATLCGDLVKERLVMVNNVDEPKMVHEKYLEMYNSGLIDGYCQVDHFAPQALDHFGLKVEDFGDGYRYSIAELVAIYLCKTPYLLHFSGDSVVAKGTPKDWLKIGIEVLQRRPDVAVFNLPWNWKHEEVAWESHDEDQDCFYGYGFSDQMYLVRTIDFRGAIYGHSHPGTASHTHGEIFEKRVDAWMRTTKRLRATLRKGSYLHPKYGGAE
jgi:hypothetical protein